MFKLRLLDEARFERFPNDREKLEGDILLRDFGLPRVGSMDVLDRHSGCWASASIRKAKL